MICATNLRRTRCQALEPAAVIKSESPSQVHCDGQTAAVPITRGKREEDTEITPKESQHTDSPIIA